MKKLKKIVIYIILGLIAIFLCHKLLVKGPYYFATLESIEVSEDGRYRMEYMTPLLPIYVYGNKVPTFIKFINNKTNKVIEVTDMFDATGAGCCSFIECGMYGSNVFGDLYDKECWLKKHPGKKPPWEDPDYTKEIRPWRRLFWPESL